MSEPTLKELLKPLSAKVQPKSFCVNSNGEKITEEQAIVKQRRPVGTALGPKRRKKINYDFNECDRRRGARH